MTKFRLKKGDEVIVVTGKDKGKRGTITKVVTKDSKVLINGINLVTKHVKPTKLNPRGEIKQVEMPIHISNVAFYDGSTNSHSKIGYTFRDGIKIRISKKSQTTVVEDKK